MAHFSRTTHARIKLMTGLIVSIIIIQILFFIKPDLFKWTKRRDDMFSVDIAAPSDHLPQEGRDNPSDAALETTHPDNAHENKTEVGSRSKEEEESHHAHNILPRKQQKQYHQNDSRRGRKDKSKYNQPKYFHEPGGDLQGGHYDVRFYKGKVPYDEHRPALRHLARAYLTTLRSGGKIGVETWLAHGSLLGWWWNSRIMPWDYDLDAQMTTASLAYLASTWNGTVHEYEYDYDDDDKGNEEKKGWKGMEKISKKGKKRYLLDINPYYDYPKGNGNNLIDARWIDMDNGLFIDVTGLEQRDLVGEPGLWSCKNHHYYHTTEIWPLRQTEFEGAPASVPYAFDDILVTEYTEKSMTRTEFEGHYWDPHLKEWVKDQQHSSSASQQVLKTVVVVVEVPANNNNNKPQQQQEGNDNNNSNSNSNSNNKDRKEK